MIINMVHRLKGILFCAALLVMVMPGCGSTDKYENYFQDPDVEPIKATLRTTIPLAYAATVAMASVKGTPPANVRTSNTCSSYPCAAVVTIDVNDQTLPYKFGTGKMVVAGLWTGENNAIMSVSFVDIYGGTSRFRVRDVSTFPVTSTLTGVNIVYTDVDVNISTGPVNPQNLSDEKTQAVQSRAGLRASDEPSVNVGLDAWVIKVDHAGTPGDFSDNTYTVAGGGEYVGTGANSAAVMQVAMGKTIMTPACTINPTGGAALINEIDASTTRLPVVATAALTFNPTCDGKAKVFAATGNYLLSNGNAIPLQLNAP